MLSINDISVRIAGRLLIDQSTVQIVPGARVGFVGRNGVGKSTLFHAIRGELPTETGSISIPPRWRVGSLAQEAPDGPESLIDVVLKADLERAALLHEAETAHDPHRIADIQTRLVDIDAHSAPARAGAVLSGLGFSPADQARSGRCCKRINIGDSDTGAPECFFNDAVADIGMRAGRDFRHHTAIGFVIVKLAGNDFAEYLRHAVLKA